MLAIQRKISSYNFSSRSGNSVNYIILHYTGNQGDTAKNNVDYFYGGDRNASAHFFVDDTSIWQSVELSNAAWAVGDGHGIYGITNRNSISIEMCCNSSGVITEKTEANALELVKYLQNKYSVSNSNVVRHYDASRKMCPNWSANNWSRWWNFKNKLSGASSNSSSTPTSSSTGSITSTVSSNFNDWVNRLQIECNNQGFSNQTVDGIPGSKTLAGCPTLKKGAQGNITKLLQERLVSLGYSTNGVDGVFGSGTYSSVTQYQKAKGLSVDGIVGTNTWKALLNL